MPSYEGADEPEHLRYIEAVRNDANIHPVDRENPRRHGIEVYQPPLYYQLTAAASRLFPFVMANYIPVNADKNPNFPFLVHGRPGAIFPFTPPEKTLRYVRALSAALGLAALWIFSKILQRTIPDAPQWRILLLMTFILWPNNIRSFSVVSNDALAYTLSLALVLAAFHLIQSPKPTWKQGLALGVLTGLGLATKMTVLVTVMVLCPLFFIDIAQKPHRAKGYVKILPALTTPVALLCMPFMLTHYRWYGNLSGGTLHDILVPSVLRPIPLSFPDVAANLLQVIPQRFLVDLCWQSFTFPVVSILLFSIWFLPIFILVVRYFTSNTKEFSSEDRQSLLLAVSALFVMCALMVWISSRYVHMQVRHTWALWPLTLLAIPLVFKNSPIFYGHEKHRVFKLVLIGWGIVLLAVNIRVFHGFVQIHEPVREISGPDRNYFSIIEDFANGPPELSAYFYHTGKKPSVATGKIHLKRNHDQTF
jgi:hypothetical protein